MGVSRHISAGSGADKALSHLPKTFMKTPVLLVSLALALGACTLAGARRQSVDLISSEAAPAAAGAVSRFRAASGLGPVMPDETLNAAARQQARAMAEKDVLSHDAAGSFWSRMNGTGQRFTHGAENIAMGQRSLDEVMDDWRRSAEHRRNMLQNPASHIGFAHARAGGRDYWVLVVGGTAPRGPQLGL
ncbi:Uncharacterized conserved protein YkwD, contains CAP (CSP/antigen 5/PR1) domain [Chelatococcus sambhunathii]|uniref:SCP domain-containing protein n=3 Tax=Chelatococcaceae TaxID=2036754 RepID=A0AAC9JU59_9HYPH|nr:hypothetical protein BOQ54_08400 [Chelatococcus daeguensis]CUA86612.1 Uncharacterized conserved protein YkwD, contains CAP (CSP/antigen 5/PR1) domain [Chelatococcus sambhunathii]